MKDLAKPALENVLNDEVKFHPPKFKNLYKHWMENIRDWCISRQLWWGQRIPVYYLSDGDFVVAENIEEAVKLAQEKSKNPNLSAEDLKQDEDVLDTWASSWLWPISVFDGINNPENEDIKYYYSTSDLITAPDIIFFWVARMIIAGYEYRDEKPFENFMQLSDALFAANGSTWKISLQRQFVMIYDIVKQRDDVDKSLLIDLMEVDYDRSGEKKSFNAVISGNEKVAKMGVANKRQQQMLQ